MGFLFLQRREVLGATFLEVLGRNVQDACFLEPQLPVAGGMLLEGNEYRETVLHTMSVSAQPGTALRPGLPLSIGKPPRCHQGRGKAVSELLLFSVLLARGAHTRSVCVFIVFHLLLGQWVR